MHLLRAIEFLALFFGAPTLYALDLLPIPVIVLLVAVALACLAVLLTDREFDRKRLWNAGRLRPRLGRMLSTFAIVSLILSLAVFVFRPHYLFLFVLRRPLLWAIVMVLYPLLSVYPQELIYRAFLFQRYRVLFPGRWTMIIASAVAFGYVHIVFENAIAVVLTLGGGFLFAKTYDETQSTLAAAVEHALYGCFIFTIGLGFYFYKGTIQVAEFIHRSM